MQNYEKAAVKPGTGLFGACGKFPYIEFVLMSTYYYHGTKKQ